jgi:hypothetical protein
MKSISLFFHRYLDPQNTEAPFSQEAVLNMPVDLYIGGSALFWMKTYLAM